MQDIVSFTYWPTPIQWSILCGILAAITLFSFYKFSVPTRFSMRLALLILRSILLAGMILILLDPYWSDKELNRWWFGVLIDNSPSMAVTDEDQVLSRLEGVKSYLKQDPFWKEISKENLRKIYLTNPQLQTVSSTEGVTAQGERSSLCAAIRQINRDYREDSDLAGWILFSDGALTDPPRDEENCVENLSFPWIAVQAGQEGPVANIQMLAPRYPKQSFSGEKITVKTQWKARQITDTAETRLMLEMDGEKILDEAVHVNDEEKSIEILTEKTGVHAFRLWISTGQAEGSLADNETRFWIRTLPREIRVFYSESYFKDENLFKKSLEEDAEFKVRFASSLTGFAKKKTLPFFQDPVYGFPKTRAEILQYDAVILSDVKRSLLTAEQTAGIRELVEKEGGALIMIGGIDSFGDGGYVGSDIEQMLPVEISEEYKKDTFLAARGNNEKPFRPMLKPEASGHPLMQLAESESENDLLWKSIPLLGGYNYVGRAKPGAQVLLEHPEDKSQHGPRIVLALQSFGKGKVLAFTSDVTENWGAEFQHWRSLDDTWVFAKFWRQAIKHMTENRARKKTEPFQLSWDPGMPEEGQAVKIKITFAQDLSETTQRSFHLNLSRGNDGVAVKEQFFDPKERSIVFNLESLASGQYQAQAYLPRGLEPPLVQEETFFVAPDLSETRQLDANIPWMKNLAKKTGGMSMSISEPEKIQAALEQLNRDHLRRHSRPAWHQPWVYGTILALLFLDWLIRKRNSLE